MKVRSVVLLSRPIIDFDTRNNPLAYHQGCYTKVAAHKSSVQKEEDGHFPLVACMVN